MLEVPPRSVRIWGSASALASKEKLAAVRKVSERWFVNALMSSSQAAVSGPARRRDKLAPSRYGQEDLSGKGAFVAGGCCETARTARLARDGDQLTASSSPGHSCLKVLLLRLAPTGTPCGGAACSSSLRMPSTQAGMCLSFPLLSAIACPPPGASPGAGPAEPDPPANPGPDRCRGSGELAPVILGSSSQPPTRTLIPSPAWSQAAHRERNEATLLLAASTWGAAMCCTAVTQAIRRCQLGFVAVGEQTRPRSSPRALWLLLGRSSALPTYLGSPLHPSGLAVLLG